MFLFLTSAENLNMFRKMKILMLYLITLFYPQISVSENKHFCLTILKMNIYTIGYIYMVKAQQYHIKS